MSVILSPFGPKRQFVDAQGNPRSGAKLFFYAAGTSTKLDTYTSASGAVANTNPVILDSLGSPASEIWFTEGSSYKAVLAPSTDTDPPTSPIWTDDNLIGISSQISPQEWTQGTTPTYVSVSSFSVAGDQRSTYQAGRRVKTTNGGGTVYSTISASAFGSGITTVSVVSDSGGLDSSISAVYYSFLSSQGDAVPRGFRADGYAQVVGGTANAITLTPSPAISGYVAGTEFNFLAASTNTSSVTLAVSGLSATPVLTTSGSALTGGEIQPGFVSVIYDGSAFRLMTVGAFQQAGTGTVARSLQGKMRGIVSTSDYSSVANAQANITTRGSVFVERGVSSTPSGATGKDVGYFFIDGGDADNILQFDGTRGGLYSDYDCKANFIIAVQIDADQSAVSGGGFRDGLFIDVVDDDTVDYTAIGNKVTHGLRSFVQGKHNGTDYQAIYKDLVGAYFSAAGNTQWSARGVSAITSDAWQFGVGIASNEFAINNPASGNGGLGQSVSGAAIDAIVRFDYADEDGTHFAYGAVIENSGKRITAGIMLFSNTSRGYSGHFKHLLYAADAITTGSAIVMPQSASGDVGTIIAYDSNDYSYFDRTNNRFNWINGGSLIASMTPNGLALGSATTTGTWLFIEASTTSKSHLRMFQGVAPSSPAAGDFWYDGTNLKFQNGATLRTISWV